MIYVRHDDGPGSDLTHGTEGFEIYEEFKPEAGERISAYCMDATNKCSITINLYGMADMRRVFRLKKQSKGLKAHV